MREEARVGQRTTLDVLNAQQDLVNARVALVTAQRDRVVASYTVLAAVGSLSPQILGLGIEVYDPMTHYQQVRDAWGGVRTPDGASAPNSIAHRRSARSVDDRRKQRCLRSTLRHAILLHIRADDFGRLIRMELDGGLGTGSGLSGDAADDATCQGARALDGGDSRLHS